MRKRILMIGTGGTIASVPTEQGLAPGLTVEELLNYVPAVKEICDVDAIQVCSLDSTNVSPEHWKIMTDAVERHYEQYDGFVLCHGTDTMAYTAAALSYMIQDSPKPIVITGAQKPIHLDSTDAKNNLLDSFLYAADDASQNVNLVFDGKVIAGTRAKKVRAKSYNAFSSINFPYLAVIQDGMLVRYIPEKPCQGPVRFYHQMKNSIFVLKLIPGMQEDLLPYLFSRYDCLILESFGVGGVPQQLVETFYREMEKWSSRGKVVVMATQVANEGSNMTVYEVGKKVKQDFQMLETYDMTLEAAITKLMWLLGRERLGSGEIQRFFYKQVNHDILFSRFFERKSGMAVDI